MSKFRLRTYSPMPPGQFPFEENGVKFPGNVDIEEQARKVLDFRTANGRPRATYAETLEDIDCYQCQRLGNHTRFCIPMGATASFSEVQPKANRTKQGGCGFCGHAVNHTG